MVDIYDLYKPLRNKLKEFDLRSILEELWRLQSAANVSGEVAVTDGVGRARVVLYVWELHGLCREAVIHADTSGRGTRVSLQTMISLVGHIRRITKGVSSRLVESSDDAFRALHPLMHQQARWQYERIWDRFYRAHRLFGEGEMRDVVEEVTGASLSSLLTLGMLSSRNFVTNAKTELTALGISDDERDSFFQLCGTSLDALREAIWDARPYEEGASLDESWAFKWNPIEATPLIRLDSARTNEYLCPFAHLVQRRVSDGLFYDVVRSKHDFANPYGKAFERYTGDVLAQIFNSSQFLVHGERPYIVKGQLRHGPDWIVSDGSANMFIECKTRRMALGAKSYADGAELEKSLANMAGIIVQHYKNIDDARAGLSKWERNALPIYALVLTLDDWYLFARHVVDRLEELVIERLIAAKLDTGVIDSIPYVVTSIAEFELAAQAIAHFGVERFCQSRARGKYRHFGLSTFAGEAFPDEPVNRRALFRGAGDAMLSNLSALFEMPDSKHA
ncbi:NERD domain-containing protein (plasmid) [Pararobbsia alpina]|uniref:hypothetical protein n=1 Tax=Pararobbsia alpina TaxID=621374 RepID=UPI0039A642DA